MAKFKRTFKMSKEKKLSKNFDPQILTIDYIGSRGEGVAKLFTEISVKSKDRPGGYLRIIKAGFRPGDKADMAYVEWVDRAGTEDPIDDTPELKEDSAA